MRFERRAQTSALAMAGASVIAVAFTLVISSGLVLWAGAPVAQTFGLLMQGAFGSLFAWSETLTRAVPLMLTGLAATVAFIVMAPVPSSVSVWAPAPPKPIV